MSSIDPEAAGILIENGVDVPTALVGSIIDEPRPPMPQACNTAARAIGVVVGARLRSSMLLGDRCDTARSNETGSVRVDRDIMCRAGKCAGFDRRFDPPPSVDRSHFRGRRSSSK